MNRLMLKVLVLAGVLYLLIAAAGVGYGWLSTQNPSRSTTQASTGAMVLTSDNYQQLEVIGIELVAISVIAYIEIRHKIFSTHLNLLKLLSRHLGIRGAFLILSTAGLVLLVSAFGLDIGLIAFSVLMIVALLSILERPSVFVIYAFVSFLLFDIIMARFAAFFTTSDTVGFILFIVGVAVAMKLSYVMEKVRDVKLRINLVSACFAIALAMNIGWEFSPLASLALLGLFSVYDFIAVFVTKHMQAIAQKSAGLGIPAMFMFGDIEELNRRLNNDPTLPHVPPEQRKSAALGSGDIMIPGVLIFSIAIMNPVKGFVMAVGALIGMTLNLMIISSGRVKWGIPALPMMAVAMGALYFL